MARAQINQGRWLAPVRAARAQVRRWRKTMIVFFAVIGPVLITSTVDNVAGGIYTYSLAGAQFGYLLLWTLIPMTLILYI
ncbi:MAG: hypothetical protein HY653_02130, partial [Acidobacteria bacterium]|nr:hypothetical protein [Acidobacteriota bacterium]